MRLAKRQEKKKKEGNFQAEKQINETCQETDIIKSHYDKLIKLKYYIYKR